jgi:hypothetical protein
MCRLVPSSQLTVTLPLLLCAVVALPVSHADTEAIKLTCELEVTTHPADGEVKQSHETALVVMLFDAATGFKAITIHSVAIPVAVANKKGGAVTSFVDNSDESRWDISNRRDRSKVASEESATIDRNTGRLTAYSITTVGDASQHVEARGSCATIDTGKRKFQAQVPSRRPRGRDTDEITASGYAVAAAEVSQDRGAPSVCGSPVRGTAVSASTLQPASTSRRPVPANRPCTRSGAREYPAVPRNDGQREKEIT